MFIVQFQVLTQFQFKYHYALNFVANDRLFNPIGILAIQ